MKPLYTLTDEEAEILKASASNPQIFFDYWFRKDGAMQGWQLDYNFEDEGKWQERMCMAPETFIVAICGIATGKTVGVVMSAAYHAAQNETFRFMNIAREIWQSKLAFQALLDHAENAPFSKLIYESPTKPYLKIGVGFKYKSLTFRSSLEFMSLGDKKDAKNILSWRGDWINIEEASRVEGLSEIVGRLSTRLTGQTAAGREYMGRFSLISNPDEDPELWQMFAIAEKDKENGLTFQINTEDNKNVTERQVKAIINKLDDAEDIEKYLTGRKPKGKGIYFKKEAVVSCEREELSRSLLHEYKEGHAILHKENSLGVYHFERKYNPKAMYMLLGDPGIGSPPARNSPCLMLWNVTDAPKLATLDAFWWASGGGSILPFTFQLFDFIKKYKVFYAGVDSTGTQKNTAEILNFDYFTENHGMSINGLTPMDFSGGRRYTYLICARQSIENGQMIFPDIASAIGAQLRTYDPVKDRDTGKLPQDIVATFAMSAYSIRAWYGEMDEKNGDEITDEEQTNLNMGRTTRTSSARARDAVRNYPTPR